MSSVYKKAGVDVNAGYQAVDLMKDSVQKTFSSCVLSGIGGFGGLFSMKAYKDMEEPVMVAGTDGVGTKLKIAFVLDRHDTVGLDCVAMCVNDIICSGAKPLFFLDYIACGKNYPEKVASIVQGIAEGCSQAGCALIGGETAEMPGFYPKDEYDLAGFAVGIVERNKIIDGSSIGKGDVLVGLASNGVHSNGFSLVRKIFRENCFDQIPDKMEQSIGETLLTPTRIYVKPVLNVLEKFEIKGISHITGGGFFENIPRMLPPGLGVKIEESRWQAPQIFNLIQKEGNIEHLEMYHVFNMGIGMVLAVDEKQAEHVCAAFEEQGERASVIGTVTENEGVEIC